jgi:WD40 repeat protein
MMVLTLALVLVTGRGLPAQELKELATVKGEWDVVALRPDGKMVATADWKERNGKVVLWDLPSGKQVAALILQMDRPEALAFSPDGKLLASVGTGNSALTVWDVTARKPLVSIRENVYPAYALAFSLDGKKLGAADSRQVRVWDVTSGKRLSSFRRRVRSNNFATAFSRDLGTLASGNYQEIDLWDVNTGKLRAILSEHRGEVNSLHFSQDDKTLVASSILRRRNYYQYVGDVRLWDVATGKERKVFPDGIGQVGMVRLSPDGKTLLACVGLRVTLMDVATGKQRIVDRAPGYYFSSHSFTTDGRLFVIGRAAPPTARPSSCGRLRYRKAKVDSCRLGISSRRVS